ncbi:MAG: alpha/beta fold hydrolase, partial [Bdellovibrionota bacterium]
LVAHLRALGADAQWQQQADHLGRDIQLVSNEDHRSIAADLAAWVVSMHAGDVVTARTEPTVTRTSLENELPLLFGEQDSLFGVLVSPTAENRDPERPVVITMVHRLGPNRNYVPLARELAALGFHILRLDLSGRGDSVAPTPEEEESPYPIRTLDNVREAMDLLEKRVGAKRFIVAGLCSGADLAFHTAQNDPRFVGLVMINPRTFANHDIPTLETLVRSQDLGGFMSKFLDKKNWLKLLRGEFFKSGEVGKFDTKSPLGKLADALKQRIQSRREEKSGHNGAPEGGIRTVPATFRKITQRGVDTLLVVRTGDLGITYADLNCGKAMRALESSKGFRRVTIQEVDHNFTTMYAQQELIRAVAGHFSARA